MYEEESTIYMDFEEDEEGNSRGADRKKIKVLAIDYDKVPQNSNRRNIDVSESQFTAETAFDFIYECPLS